MTTLDVVNSKKKSEPSAEADAARELVRLAQEQGLSLTGPDGLLKQFTKSVLEAALNKEMTEHLGHEKRLFAIEGVVRGSASESGWISRSSMMGVPQLPIRKTSTCPTLPLRPLT